MSLDRVVLITGVSLTMAFLWLTKRRLGLQVSISLHTVALVVPVFGIFAASAFSALVGPSVIDRQETLKSLFLNTFTILLAIYLADKASVLGSPVRLLGKISLVLAFASIVGIFMTLAYTTPLDIIAALGFQPAGGEMGTKLLGLEDLRFFGLPRSQGFLTHPIEYGAVLVLSYSVIRARPDVIRRSHVRWIVCFLLLLGGLSSGSLSAWLGFIIAELVIRYFRLGRVGRIYTAITLAVVTVSSILLSLDTIASYTSYLSLNSNSLSESLTARLADYRVVFGSLRDNLFGVGYESWTNYAQSRGWSYQYYYLDNDYLRFLAQGGALGLLMYLLYEFRVFLPLPYARPSKLDWSVAYTVTGVYAWQALVFDAFAFQGYEVLSAILITIALRLGSKVHESRRCSS